jgi:hypothetical protein
MHPGITPSVWEWSLPKAFVRRLKKNCQMPWCLDSVLKGLTNYVLHRMSHRPHRQPINTWFGSVVLINMVIHEVSFLLDWPMKSSSAMFTRSSTVMRKRIVDKWIEHRRGWKTNGGVCTYFNRKRMLHVNPQGLEISTLIREKDKYKITHHYHYNFMVKNILYTFWLQLRVIVCNVSKTVLDSNYDSNPHTTILFGLLKQIYYLSIYKR